MTVPLFMRLIGASQWGLLMLFQAAAAPVALLDLGMGPAMIKRVSEALGRGDYNSVASSIRAALSFMIIVLVAGGTLIILVSGWFARSAFAIPPGDVAVAVRGFRFVALWWMATAALAFASNVFVAHQRYDEVLRGSMFALLATTSAGLAAAAVTRDASWVMLGQAVGTLVAAIFVWRRATRLVPAQAVGFRWDGAELRRLLAFGGWYTVANTGVMLASWSDRYVLGAFFAPAVVGFYAIAQQMQQLIASVFSEASDVLLPAVSLRHGRGDVGEARKLALLAGWLLTTVFGPVAVTVGVLGGDFLRLWISPTAAQEAAGVLRLLCATSIVALAANAPAFFALGTGQSYWQAPFSLTAGITSLIVGILLVPSMGISGAGIGLLTGAAVRWVLFVPLWRSLFRPQVPGTDFFLHVCAPPIGSLLLLAGLAATHDAFRHPPGWFGFLVEATLTLVAVTAVQFLLGEALPGGRARRRDVVGSFRPVAGRAYALIRGGGSR